MVPIATASTDDEGEYRLQKLPPASYVVMASTRETWTVMQDGKETVLGYAPTYFPGVTSISEAQPIALGLSQTAANVDFGLQLVHVARVSGHVTDPDGVATWSGNVTLVLESAAGGRGGAFGMNYGGRIRYDGTFEIVESDQQFLTRIDVEMIGRLVEKQHIWLGQQRPRQENSTLHSGLERRYIQFSVQAHPRQQPIDPLLRLPAM